MVSGRTPESPKTQREVTVSHEMDWVRACKENPANRVVPASDFAEAGPFNEMVVMGVLAVRLQGLNKELLWNGEKMEFTNIADNETVNVLLENLFEVTDGHPTDNSRRSRSNAKAVANELIRHTYRQGWALPDMPA